MERSIITITRAINIIMAFSFIHPATCGFARGVAWEISKKLDEEWKFGDIDSRSQQKQSCKIEARFTASIPSSNCARRTSPST
jgi:hypothetical protein